MNNKIIEYLREKKVYLDDLIEELDNAKSTEEIMAVALKIKGRRSAAQEMFNDLLKITNDNQSVHIPPTTTPKERP
jgi:hypothetical protein